MLASLKPDSTFEVHYSVSDLARQWRLGRETVRLLVKDEPGVLQDQAWMQEGANPL